MVQLPVDLQHGQASASRQKYYKRQSGNGQGIDKKKVCSKNYTL